jgi:hypothetical protein
MEFAKIPMPESLKTFLSLRIYIYDCKSDKRSGVVSEVFPINY